MNIEFNDKAIVIDENTNLAHLIKNQNIQGSFAVAVNMEFIPRSHYSQTVLCEGDQIELLKPMQGG
ncbi:sulfur carrier protein ThiS [Agarilytica rhodophyticola]|uniref:sulfur carrier protein ThiS n=1 Tax=Agarilytica rhodophyticola TaxID=1737490 RepID=UPI000B341086|nr:sulfur carrier protein ThiS [Agarilytica rhodophyticola]